MVPGTLQERCQSLARGDVVSFFVSLPPGQDEPALQGRSLFLRVWGLRFKLQHPGLQGLCLANLLLTVRILQSDSTVTPQKKVQLEAFRV